MALGHEMAGVVEWVGRRGDRRRRRRPGHRVPGRRRRPVRIGQRRARGRADPAAPRAQRRPSAGGCSAVPDGMSLHVAALAEPLGVGMQAVNQADVAPGDKVAVFGCGPIGLMAIATLVDRGIDDVVAIDLSAAAPRAGPGAWAPPTRSTPAAVDVWEELKRAPRHRAVHVRADRGHRRLHRGVGRRPGDRRHPPARALRRADVAWSRCTTAGAHQLRRSC